MISGAWDQLPFPINQIHYIIDTEHNDGSALNSIQTHSCRGQSSVNN